MVLRGSLHDDDDDDFPRAVVSMAYYGLGLNMVSLSGDRMMMLLMLMLMVMMMSSPGLWSAWFTRGWA